MRNSDDGAQRPFDLGASAFLHGRSFLLARGGWKEALAYAAAAARANSASIPFADVRARIEAVQADARGWTAATYPAVVALAGDVAGFGANKAPVYVASLETVLGQLGAAPTDANLAAKAAAIVDVLERTATTNAAAASRTAAEVAAFDASVRAAYAELEPAIATLAAIYGYDSSPATLPQDLEGPVAQLASAWNELASHLASLRSWIAGQLEAGTKFTADLGVNATLGSWNVVASAADEFRQGAYVGKTQLVAV
jgi:hypothetical protein